MDMRFYVLSLFPELIKTACQTSILGRAAEQGLIQVNAIDVRDYSTNKHRRVDDYPYGGGAGMVMQAEPIYLAHQAALRAVGGEARFIYLSPQGRVFNQAMAAEYAKEANLILLCGHYEGVDERALEATGAELVSIGDYIVTGGELPALVMVDAIARLVPGVVSNEDSTKYETFHEGLLEYPQYTRPEEFMGRKVPEVLLSGHHANIERWRREQSLLRTKDRRPDLLDKQKA